MVENLFLDIMVKARSYFCLIRKNWIAPFFLLLEDIWLYNYHDYEYKGNTAAIFETFRIIEEKKWVVYPFNQLLAWAGVINDMIPDYHGYSNEKYVFK